MTRVQRILLIVLVVQVVLLGLVRFLGSRGGGSAAGEVLLPGFDPARASRIEVRSRDGDTLRIEREAAGWGIADFGGYPADTAKVNRLLRDLEELRVGAPVVTSDRYHAALSVSDTESERRVLVWQEGGADPAVDLLLGSAPNATRTYARRAGDGRVFEVDGLASYDVSAAGAAWIVGRIFEFPAERVAAFAIQNAGGALRAVREATAWRVTDPPKMAGRLLDPGKVEDFLRSSSAVYAAEPLGRAADGSFTAAALRVELVDESGAPAGTRALLVGERLPGEGERRGVTSEGSGFAAVVHENGVQRLLTQRWPDFLP